MAGRSMALLLVASVLGGMALGVRPLLAHEAANPFLPVGAPTEPPRGFTEMCGAQPALCRSFAGAGAKPVESGGASLLGLDAPVVPTPPLSVLALDLAPRPRLGCRVDGFSVLEPSCRIEVEWRAPERTSFAPTPIVNTQIEGPGLLRAALFLPAIPAVVPSTISGPESGGDWRKLLRRVNGRVNARVYQQSDMATYGVGELWRPSGDRPGAVGDCEDLALQKRVELLASHFPPERLFLAVVYRAGVGLHTVLVARLSEGDVVLDSRVDYIEPWHRAGYSWLSVETPGEPQEWRAVEQGAA